MSSAVNPSNACLLEVCQPVALPPGWHLCYQSHTRRDKIDTSRIVDCSFPVSECSVSLPDIANILARRRVSFDLDPTRHSLWYHPDFTEASGLVSCFGSLDSTVQAFLLNTPRLRAHRSLATSDTGVLHVCDVVSDGSSVRTEWVIYDPEHIDTSVKAAFLGCPRPA